jgi:hypothetical protein
MRQGALFCATCIVLSGPVHAAAGEDPVEIVRKSVERDANNFARIKNYTFIEREEDRDVDSKGRIKKTESETAEILILVGRPYSRIIAKNDKPLSEKEQQAEQRKLDKELEKRQKESENERGRFERDRAENRRFLREIPEAFKLTLLGTETVSGKPVWVIDATPKPGYRPKLDRSKVLSHIHARLWIDQAEYQWVKVDAEVLDTITFAVGLLRIAPGTKLHFEQIRVNDEVWLPSLLSVQGRLRIAYVKKMEGGMDVTYRDYRKFQSDSQLVTTGDP